MNLPPLDFWLLHAAASLLGAALVWTLALGLHRTLRISHASRGYWLGVWALAVLPTGLAIAARWLVPESAILPLPVLTDMGGWSTGTAMPLDAIEVAPAARAWLGPVLALLYLAGAGIAARRWIAGALAIRRLLDTSGRCDQAFAWGPLATAESDRLHRLGIRLRLIDTPTSPFAVCWPQRAVVMPMALAQRLSDRQLQLVLRHEAAHLAGHDPQRAALMRLVEGVLWFNPFVRLIGRRVQAAAELRCDAEAIGAEDDTREIYAQAYLRTLRLSAGMALPCPATAFARRRIEGHKLRISHMVYGDPRRRTRLWLRVALGALALAAGGAMAIVQVTVAEPAADPVAFASSAVDDSAVDGTLVDGTTAIRDGALAPPRISPQRRVDVAFESPIVAGRITGRYGTVGPPRSRPHRGLDFAAARGTPVHAPAAGVVAAATERYDNAPNYGTVVVLDHGGGWQSLYAHLDGFDVAVGGRVVAGQRIGRVGTTGKTTGPHVHVELFLHGQRVDPEPRLR